jgi:formate hydrogenlyase transcriptional activator
MASHPGARKRHFPDELPVTWDPIWRVLEENADWYRDLVEHSHDLLCVHDLEGRFLSVNPVPARLLGYSVEEMMRKPMREFVDPQFRAEFDAYLREIERTGESHGLLAVMARSGERRIWEYHNTLRTEGVARPIVRGIAHDITDRVRAEKALRATNEKLLKTAREQEILLNGLTLFRTLLDQSNDAIEVVDPETLSFLDVNERSCVELGYSREELLSMTVFDIDLNVNDESRVRLLQRLRESGFAIRESVRRRKDGTTFPVEVNMRRVQLDREYVVAVSRDITARKRTEERLAQSEASARARAKELETMLDAMPVPVLIAHDAECRRITGNRAAYEHLHVPVGGNFSKSAPSDEQPDFRLLQDSVEVPADLLPMQQAAATGKPVYGRALTMVFENGAKRETLANAVPLLDETGQPRGAVGALIDVTELKQAEKTLQESELRFRTVYERSPIGIGLVDSHGRFLQVNPKFCEITGRSEEELLRIDVDSITHPDDIGKTGEFLQHLAEKKLPNYEMEKRYLRPDGSVRWVRIQAVPMLGKGEQRWYMGLVEDITERRRAEEALRQSEERFRVAIKNSPIAVFNQDRDLRYTWMYNPRLGRTADEMLGKTTQSFVDQEQGKRITEVRRRVLETGVGARHEIELTQEGKKYYLDVTIEPVFDSSGKVTGLTGANMDVTELREATEALREAKKKLAEEKLYLEQQIDTELGFGEIIGQSKALQSVMEHVGKVAASNATVLLLGETGTGKELVARAIHRLSLRANNTFIKLNCAAIPSGLLESELFGNEKGAYTGAVSKKIGRLELADKGTLFLDEIGEISLALQPKLLRVLQDQEFERLGGTQTLKVDFRLIAATNRDLADCVREDEFRSDLYYRLNVFPIRVPPLRERREDIRLLVEHFTQKFAWRMNKSITSIPKKTMEALTEWRWPGNVRELENFIERSVILTQGSVLVSPLSELEPSTSEKRVDETLEATEREYILRALRESKGQIGGLKGAAMRLGLKRTTLQSKLKHLGIDPRSAWPGQ